MRPPPALYVVLRYNIVGVGNTFDRWVVAFVALRLEAILPTAGYKSEGHIGRS